MMRALRHFLHLRQTPWLLIGPLAILLILPGTYPSIFGRGISSTPLNSSTTPLETEARAAYDRLPLAFEENEGQHDLAVRFSAHGHGYALALTPTEALLSLSSPTSAASPPNALHFRFPGANPAPTMQAEQPLPGIVNSFIGNDLARWRTNIPTAARVRYTALYPGIDLTVYGTAGGAWEYDVVVAPGADPARFALSVDGATGMTLDTATGDLVLITAAGEVRQHAPMIYQRVGGERQAVAGEYLLREDGTVGFRVGEYDPSLPLVIDPTLVYSTYLGGSGSGSNGLDQGFGIAVDTSGNAYVTGVTTSADFPGTPPMTYHGSGDAFVTKLNGSGALVFSTYLGGGASDKGNGIAVDTNGNAYVTGNTASTDFPVTDHSTNHGGIDAFVAKVNGSGGLVYSTYLGGNADDGGVGIAVDTFGNAYVTGGTSSSNFPATDGSTNSDNLEKVFVTRLNATGTRVYSTYFGGSTANGGIAGGIADMGLAIALDGSGNAYVTGSTFGGFPVTDGSTFGGGISDAFVVKVNGSGMLIYGTYLGGSNYDQGNGIAVDTNGNAYVTGYTLSMDFPVTNGSTLSGTSDAFVTKLSTSGARIYSTHLGGSGYDRSNGIAIDAGGNAYVTGSTDGGFPVTDGSTFGGGTSDAFVAKVNGSGALVYGAYLGGSGADEGDGIAVDTSGRVYITGKTAGTNFPVTPGSLSFGGGGYDAFVTKLVVSLPLAIAPTTLPSGVVGTLYSQTITASGGAAPYSFVVTSGILPTGLALASNGTLNGTPTGAGSFTFTITATDSLSATGNRAYTLVISAPNPNPLPPPRAGGGTGGGPPRALPAPRPTVPVVGVPNPLPPRRP